MRYKKIILLLLLVIFIITFPPFINKASDNLDYEKQKLLHIKAIDLKLDSVLNAGDKMIIYLKNSDKKQKKFIEKYIDTITEAY